MRFKPIYRIVIGASEIDATKDIGASTVLRLDIERDMRAHLDRFELHLAPVGGAQPREGEDVAISLGFDATLTPVFTGKVAAVSPEITVTRVIGVSTLQALGALRVDRTYEGHTAGRIVRDLASQAGVKTATIEDGIDFIVYVIDGRRSAARHIHHMAERCGFDAYALPTGELAFHALNPQASAHEFVYGQDVLSYALAVQPALVKEVVVAGHSPASAKGDGAVSWLTKDFKNGQASQAAGSGARSVLVEDPALRTTDAANLSAQGALRRFTQRAITGTMRALGRPEVKLGDAIRIKDAPDARLNNTFQVRAVRHHLSRMGGLVTEVDFWSMP
jgi:phage protein D